MNASVTVQEKKTSLWRSFSVAVGMAFDIALNYPAWVAAKRLGVGLPAFPNTIRETYQGGGALFLSLGPTCIVEDAVTTALQQVLPHSPFQHLLSAALSGAVAAVTVCAQVEHIITKSHARAEPLLETTAFLYRTHGFRIIMLPPGMLAMVFREIPFASALFYIRPFLSEKFIDRKKRGAKRFLQEFACGVSAALVGSPISHVPSVIVAYQQGHGVTPNEAIAQLYAAGGPKEFWRGLFPRTFSLAGTFTVVPIVMDLLNPQKD